MSSAVDGRAAAAPASGDAEGALLEMRGVTAGYGRSTVLRDVSISVGVGSVVALLGSNGAGKTTLLRTASGLLSPSQGHVAIKGQDVTRSSPAQRAQAGLCLVPEGRGVFRELSVKDNLRVQRPAWVREDHSAEVIDMFPVLGRRLGQLAGSLSGGEQQMLALGRTFMAEPSVVLLDEVSMGLAPIIVEQIFVVMRALADRGVSLLLVEQYVDRALEMADEIVLIDRGRITFSGRPDDLDHDALLRNYLGVGLGDNSLEDRL